MPSLKNWPTKLIAAYYGRVAIMHFDGKLDLAIAERLAMRDTWESAQR